jgi:DNA-binding transcriptional LysR family regulator
MITHADHASNAWQNAGMAEFTLVGLRVLREVAATGSFTAAADNLGYTQSAISRQIAATESAAGSTLFDRGRRGVRLTAAGEALVRHAATVLAGVEAAQSELAGLRDRLAGRVAVGAFPTASAALVPRALAQLRADHPGIEAAIDEGSTPALLRRLRSGRIEVAVIAVGHGLPDYDLRDMRQDVLSQGGLMVAVSEGHRLTRLARIRPADLATERWIVTDGTDPQFGAWPTLTEPHIAYTVRNWPTRLGLVAAGLGISVLPDLAAPTVPAGVRVLRVDDTGRPGRSAVIVTPAARSPRAAAVVTAIKNQSALLYREVRNA